MLSARLVRICYIVVASNIQRPFPADSNQRHYRLGNERTDALLGWKCEKEEEWLAEIWGPASLINDEEIQVRYKQRTGKFKLPIDMNDHSNYGILSNGCRKSAHGTWNVCHCQINLRNMKFMSRDSKSDRVLEKFGYVQIRGYIAVYSSLSATS